MCEMKEEARRSVDVGCYVCCALSFFGGKRSIFAREQWTTLKVVEGTDDGKENKL